ncbi:MAG: hypothetical protein AB7U83_08165 [Vicinamibacterales bacterium]
MARRFAFEPSTIEAVAATRRPLVRRSALAEWRGSRVGGAR